MFLVAVEQTIRHEQKRMTKQKIKNLVLAHPLGKSGFWHSSNKVKSKYVERKFEMF
jgi:hypothetical protein